MKKKLLWLFILLIIGIIMVSCAPKGISEEKTAKRDDFGCWPPSCSLIPNQQGKQMCEDWKAGKQVQWFDCSMMATFPKCVKLCEFEMKNNPAPDSQDYNQSSSYGEDSQGYDKNYHGTAPQNQQQDTGIPASDPESGSVYIYISDQTETGCDAKTCDISNTIKRRDSRIVRIDDMTGKGWVSFGTTGKGVNQFNNPNHLTIGPDGKIYIADSQNDRIVRIDNMAGKRWITYRGSC